MGERKNQKNLSPQEKDRFVAAVKHMKTLPASSPHNYNQFVTIHETAFNNAADDNPAHIGPAFFPWHRYFLLKFEQALQAADLALAPSTPPTPAESPPRGQLTLPYWDWANDQGQPGSTGGEVWDWLGGFGSPVTTGPFKSGDWTLVGGGSLVRRLGRGGLRDLPTLAEWDRALRLEGYDYSPWDDRPVEGPSLAAPTAPAPVGATGGTLAGGTYRVVVTYTTSNEVPANTEAGYPATTTVGETRPSPEATICLGSACSPPNAFNAISVPSPVTVPSATGYKVYVTAAGGASGSWTLQGGVRTLGTATTITSVTPGADAPTINTTGSFRNYAEGFPRPDAPAPPAPQPPHERHNRVHIWVGGSMSAGTSPNDPIFFLHHCNVDRLWALWQFRHPGQNYPKDVLKVGVSGRRPHGLEDPMPPWTTGSEIKRPREMLNHTALGYTYDTDPAGVTIIVTP